MPVTHMNSKVAAYQQVAAHGSVAAADPQRLITLLLDGALTRIAEARGCLQRAAREEKTNHLRRALAIVTELRACLALEHGELPANLDRLYEFVERAAMCEELQQVLVAAGDDRCICIDRHGECFVAMHDAFVMEGHILVGNDGTHQM